MADIATLLSDCLNALERGELTREGCLARYPQNRVELESLLKTVDWLRASPAIAPSPLFRRNARVRLGRRLSPRAPSQPGPTQPAPPAPKPNLLPRVGHPPDRYWPVLLSAAAIPIALIGIVLTVGLAWLAISSLPTTSTPPNVALTLLALETTTPSEGAYCYVSINNQPYQRLPDGLALLTPDPTDPQRYTFASPDNQIALTLTTADSLTFAVECWARLGSTAQPLGEAQAIHPATDWDATPRALVGDSFTLRYCVGDLTTECIPP